MSTSVGLQRLDPQSQQARVKGRTLLCPEGMVLSPYSFKHGQGLPHSHYPGMRDFTQSYISRAGFFIGGTVQFLLLGCIPSCCLTPKLQLRASATDKV